MGMAAEKLRKRQKWNVLVDTRDLTPEEWLEWRRKGIGGSDVAKIAGLSKWGNRLTVWLDKLGQMEHDEAGEAAYWGTVMEPILAQEFTRRTGNRVHRMNKILQHGDPELYFMIANVDRVLVGQDAGLELKTASEWLRDSWDGDEVPDAYYLQCQHYMAITGFSRWWIAALIGGNKFVYKCIERDEETIEAMIQMEREFWTLVENETPPELDGSEASAKVLKMKHPASNGQTTELSSEALKLIEERDALDAHIKALEELKKAAENKLKAMLGDYEVGYVGTRSVIWKTITSNRLDTKALKVELPDVYEKFVKPSTTRRFEIK